MEGKKFKEELRMNIKDLKDLEIACKPIVDYLKENYNPYTSVIITDTQIKLVEDLAGIPVVNQEVPIEEQSKIYININLDETFTKEVTNKISELIKLLSQEPKIY